MMTGWPQSGSAFGPSARRKLTPVPFTRVRFDDAFWAPRLEVNRTASLDHIYRQLEAAGRISAFDLNFSRPVPSPIVQIFGDSDTAKWLEAACCSLALYPDPELRARVDDLAARILRAQQPDGYLNTHFIAAQPDMRWKNLRDWHELYCAGHLIEAAVTHAQATGQPALLAALCRYADHIAGVFGPEPGKKRGYPGHPEIELALVRLAEATGQRRYLDLASYFVDERGRQPHYYDLEARERGEDPARFWARTYEYCQAHLPVREQDKVVGHAVRAMYLLCAAADLAHANDDPSLRETGERLWHNLITRRMYLTGGIGPSRHNEGFTEDYDLPDETAYAETCATIGLMMWNHRLLQFDGQRKYADVMERGLYNGFLSGVSLDGQRFFYENPLASAGGRQRQPWFDCPCCPPNVARVLASLGGYVYSTDPDGIWVHLFAGSQAQLEVGGRPVSLRQSTRYPWDGAVKLEIETGQPAVFTLHLRVPGWCQAYRLAVNGVPQQLEPEANGYLALTREWRAGDAVEYRLDMPIRPVWAHPNVRQLQGRVALQRGPLVYCLEGRDHGQISLDQVSIDPARIENGFTVEDRPDLLGGVAVIRGRGRRTAADGWGDELYRSAPPRETEIDLTAVPYCVWANREPGEMRVWLRAVPGGLSPSRPGPGGAG